MLKALLLAIGGSVAKKVLAALGIGLITYTVSTAVLTVIENELRTHMGGIPSDVMQIISLYGFPDALGIILGAYATSLTVTTFKKFGFL